MQPLTTCPPATLINVRALLFDIDDTLTSDGRLTAEAYSAIEQLHLAGLKTIPITGRPAGWCDHIARMWPVDAVVGENGAFYFRYDHPTRKMYRRYVDDDSTRTRQRERLREIGKRILAAVPGSAIAADQHYRECDLAIDFCEDVPRLPSAAVDDIVAHMQRHGLTAKVSSIHVNGWFGDYDKLGMTRLLMREAFGIDLDAARGEFVFVGDSPNDAPMFGYFPTAVGVANVIDFGARVVPLPAYVTKNRCGAGFAELAAFLIAARHREPVGVPSSP